MHEVYPPPSLPYPHHRQHTMLPVAGSIHDADTNHQPLRRVTLPFDSPPTSPSYADFSTLPTTSSTLTGGRDQYAAFISTRSRVIRLYNLPPNPAQPISDLFSSTMAPSPITMWCLREDCGGPIMGEEDSVWCVFTSHEDAKTYVRLAAPIHISIATALERDLEPYAKLRRFQVPTKLKLLPQAPPPASQQRMKPLHPPNPIVPYLSLPLRSTISSPDLRSNNNHYYHQGTGGRNGYELSSNPPDKPYAFRFGDWVCGETGDGCGAHNFGKNQSCIGCSAPRPTFLPSIHHQQYQPSTTPSTATTAVFPFSPPPPQQQHHQIMNSVTSALASSPRFQHHSSSHSHSQPHPYQQRNHFHSLPSSPITSSLPPTLQANHILTPSGHALAIGGRVRNVGVGPGSVPCVMWWPDNEPLPSVGQVRPVFCGAQPPIMNTGNRGPIEHQPGDWICGKCHYLNWRRRKVCATCYPYAEGNLDGVSPAVLAERIALLRNVVVREMSFSHAGDVGGGDGWQPIENHNTVERKPSLEYFNGGGSSSSGGSRPSTASASASVSANGMIAPSASSPTWGYAAPHSSSSSSSNSNKTGTPLLRQRHQSNPQQLEFGSPASSSGGTTTSSSDLSSFGGGGGSLWNQSYQQQVRGGPLLPSFLRNDSSSTPVDDHHSSFHRQQGQQQHYRTPSDGPLYSPFSSPSSPPLETANTITANNSKFRFSPWGEDDEVVVGVRGGNKAVGQQWVSSPPAPPFSPTSRRKSSRGSGDLDLDLDLANLTIGRRA